MNGNLKKTETIEFFESEKNLILPLPEEDEDMDCDDVREWQGYKKFNFFTPFFHTLDVTSSPYFEVSVYIKDDVKVCELWDHCGLIIQLACDSDTSFLKLMNHYCDLVHKMAQIEKILHYMENING